MSDKKYVRRPALKKVKKLVKKVRKPAPVSRYSNRISYDELVNIESEWGGTLFGPIPNGHERKFFEHKKNVWIWYESWLGKGGAPEEMMVRYEVRPAGVFKRVQGRRYEKITGAELDNFRSAARNYLTLVKNKLYY